MQRGCLCSFGCLAGRRRAGDESSILNTAGSTSHGAAGQSCGTAIRPCCRPLCPHPPPLLPPPQCVCVPLHPPHTVMASLGAPCWVCACPQWVQGTETTVTLQVMLGHILGTALHSSREPKHKRHECGCVMANTGTTSPQTPLWSARPYPEGS